jgi:hypothetical protein
VLDHTCKPSQERFTAASIGFGTIVERSSLSVAKGTYKAQSRLGSRCMMEID